LNGASFRISGGAVHSTSAPYRHRPQCFGLSSTLKDSRRNDTDCSVTCLGTCMLADFSVCSLGISVSRCDEALVVRKVE